MYGDCIFDLPHSQNGNTLPTGTRNDYRYDKQIMRVFCFSNLLSHETAYAIIDAVPLKVPENTIGFPALDLMLGIDNRSSNRLGVYVIKEYTYTKTHQLALLLNFWSKGGFDIPAEGLEQLKNAIRAFESKETKGDKLVFRLVEFIPRDELVITHHSSVQVQEFDHSEDIRINRFKSILPNKTVDENLTAKKTYYPHFSTFLNGIVTLSLDVKCNNEPAVNTIEVSLAGKNNSRGTHWMVIGDITVPIIPRYGSSRDEDTLTVKYKGLETKHYKMDNLSDFNIYDNLDEAYQNRISSNLKQAKLRLEEDKLVFDNKKLILEHSKLKAQMKLQEYTLKIQYNIELIKLLLSENALKVSENNNIKSYIEGGIKIVVAIENLVKKFKS
jgi:hypothetical protein